MQLIPTPDQLTSAAANVFDQIFRGGLADLRRTPASIIEEQPQCTVYRYLVPDESATRELPVLLVPPLAAPTLCFDLRRGCSLAEHLLALGHPTYLLEYGEIGYAARRPRPLPSCAGRSPPPPAPAPPSWGAGGGCRERPAGGAKTAAARRSSWSA